MKKLVIILTLGLLIGCSRWVYRCGSFDSQRWNNDSYECKRIAQARAAQSYRRGTIAFDIEADRQFKRYLQERCWQQMTPKEEKDAKLLYERQREEEEKLEKLGQARIEQVKVDLKTISILGLVEKLKDKSEVPIGMVQEEYAGLKGGATNCETRSRSRILLRDVHDGYVTFES